MVNLCLQGCFNNVMLVYLQKKVLHGCFNAFYIGVSMLVSMLTDSEPVFTGMF